MSVACNINMHYFSLCRKNGLSCFNPQLKHWNLRYMPIEVQAKENAHYLLYVISNESRAAASMVEVSIHILTAMRGMVEINYRPR